MRSIFPRLLVVLAAFALLAASCGDDGDDDSTEDTEPSATETDDEQDDSADAAPTSPAAIVAEDQVSDGVSIVVASITLPAPGFIAVHGDGGGSPGAVIGHSDLLPAGESTDVVVVLDEALAESGLVFPMAHIDVDGDGVYEFAPPDETTDVPGTTDAGDVAVVPAQITIAAPTSPAAIVAEDQVSDGVSIVVASITLPAPGFIAVHGDGGGSPGAVIGHSDLLPAGESTDVVVVLDEALAESGLVFPMAHIDVDGDGVYEFAPPDDTTDVPGTTEAGDVAVVPAQITIG